MRILTPAETLKDHVGDRWSFIGEDGEKALREYLKPRMPLKDQDYVSPIEVAYIAKEVLRHRIILSYEAQAEDITQDVIIEKILAAVPIP